MGIRKAADQHLNEEHWLECRKPLITSSDIYSYRGVDLPDWWSDSPQSVAELKLSGEPKDFPVEARRSMNHGISDERGIRKKVEVELGCVTAGDHGLYVNDRWPELGASIDGWLLNPTPDIAQHGTYSQDPENNKEICEFLEGYMPFGAPCLLEIKKSTSASWKKPVPPAYYYAQQQAQMHILDVPLSVIVAENVTWLQPKGEKRKRPFWDLVIRVTHRSEPWDEILDELNEKWHNCKLAHEQTSE